jgi:predicted amidohydrolase
MYKMIRYIRGDKKVDKSGTMPKMITIPRNSGIPNIVDPIQSVLKPDDNGILKLGVFQVACGKRLIGKRFSIQDAFTDSPPSANEVKTCREILNSSQPNSLSVISFHPGLRGCEAELKLLSKDRTVVGLAGNSGNGTNEAYIATDGQLLHRDKLSLSSEDYSLNFRPGTSLPVFISEPHEDADPVIWSVMNCHDYTHVDLIRVIQAYRIELLVVVTCNTATRIFWEYAIADIHRLFCYIVIVNVSEIGGSAVFAPFRSIGKEENAKFAAGGQIFGARGPSELHAQVSLDFGELRRLRASYSTAGYDHVHNSSNYENYNPIQPSEHFLATFDREAGPPIVNGISEYPFEWNFKNPCIAISQLKSMPLEAYLDSKYRIRNHKDCGRYQEQLSIHLGEIVEKCMRDKKKIDLLIFPEVFVPRSYIRKLQAFSNKHNTIVVAGVDYPDGDEDQNANECMILRPHAQPVTYRKITRSQYDAKRNEKQRMPMQRGGELVRFVNSEGRGIGVLICYDYSHLDLMWELNLRGRNSPLDLIIVVAYNPYSALYRSCCIADSHRYYQYIVMCNVSNFGGSGIYGPVRTPGSRQTLLEVGKTVETIAVVEVGMEGLFRARKTDDEFLHGGQYMRRPGVFQSRWSEVD